MKKTLWGVLVFLPAVACVVSVPAPTTPVATSAPSDGGASSEPGEAAESAQSDAAADTPDTLIARARAVEAAAKAALDLADSDDARKVADDFVTCGRSFEVCLRAAEGAQNPVGLYAGLALRLAQAVQPGMGDSLVLTPKVRSAEKAVARARDEAEKYAAGKGAREDARRAHAEMVRRISLDCEQSAPACKAQCDRGDVRTCIGWATHLWQGQPPKLAEAKVAIDRACAPGTSTPEGAYACEVAPQIESDLHAQEAKLTGLWSDVREAGDELALKRYQAGVAAKFANTPRAQAAMARMRTYLTAVVEEKYCPARKAFVAQASTAELARRASAHCAQEPPVGSGVSGVDVTLTSQCTGAFATVCR